jgi:hypothetical protein
LEKKWHYSRRIARRADRGRSRATSEKANKAAEELAGYEREFADIKADLRVLKWSQAATFAAVLAVLLKLFLH